MHDFWLNKYELDMWSCMMRSQTCERFAQLTYYRWSWQASLCVFLYTCSL